MNWHFIDFVVITCGRMSNLTPFALCKKMISLGKWIKDYSNLVTINEIIQYDRDQEQSEKCKVEITSIRRFHVIVKLRTSLLAVSTKVCESALILIVHICHVLIFVTSCCFDYCVFVMFANSGRGRGAI